MEMNIQTATTESVDETLRLQEVQKKRRKQKMILSVILILACLVFLGFWVFKNKKDLFGLEALLGIKKKDTALSNALSTQSSGLSEEELFQLAVEVRNAGLIVQGVMQCGWTRKQLDLFGVPGSKARTEFEKVYTECVSREICQDVRGFPTWARGKLQFPGYRDVDKIRELIAETKNLPVQQQVMGASLPLEENIPNAKHAVPGPKTANDEKIEEEERIQEIIEDNESSKDEETPTESLKEKAESLKEKEAAKEVSVSSKTEKTTTPPAITATTKKRKLAKKENVRGVSAYPPLNVPDMPGTSVMSIDTSYAENQVLQGNIPRESVENPNPVDAIAHQMAATFEQIAYDSTKDPRAALYSNARMPQSASITTGNPMANKAIYVEKNT